MKKPPEPIKPAPPPIMEEEGIWDSYNIVISKEQIKKAFKGICIFFKWFTIPYKKK